jgi:hypothetical protein
MFGNPAKKRASEITITDNRPTSKQLILRYQFDLLSFHSFNVDAILTTAAMKYPKEEFVLGFLQKTRGEPRKRKGSRQRLTGLFRSMYFNQTRRTEYLLRTEEYLRHGRRTRLSFDCWLRISRLSVSRVPRQRFAQAEASRKPATLLSTPHRIRLPR